jgi:AP-2 complex subunit alpha
LSISNSRRDSRVSGGAGEVAEVSAANGAVDDLLGLDGLAASAPPPVDAATAPVTTRVGIDPSVADQVTRWHNALLTKTSGVLYEDKYVQVGVRSQYTGADGKVTIFVGNKADIPLVSLKLRIPAVPGTKIDVSDAPSVVAPKSQVQVQVVLESMQPFSEAPAVQLSFISAPGTGHVYPLRLPVGVHNFCEAVAMAGDDFKSRWTALAGAPRELTAVISPGVGAVSAEVAKEALAKLHMSVIEAGAPGATGASSFRTHSVGPTGAQISVGCLAMVIPASPAYKVAVRTQHPEITKSLMSTLQLILEAC